MSDRGPSTIRCRTPSDDDIRRFIAAQASRPFSYPDVGATRATPPAGDTVDHNRVVLGRGAETFRRAVEAMRGWRMFDIEGVRLCWPTAPIAAGTTVAIVAGAGGIWSLNACRIVYAIDEESRFGFAYGTLPAHIVRGEERFLIERDHASDDVAYDILAFSRPRSRLAALARPLLRRMQQRFATNSKAAMVRATGAAW